MKIVWLVVGILAVGVLTMLWIGTFNQALIEGPQERGPFNVVYHEHRGPYHEIMKVINEVQKYLDQRGIGRKEAFGEYFDDPSLVKPEDLRSNGGFIVDKLLEEGARIELEEPYKFKTIERKLYLVVTFRGSPALGAMKAYTKAGKWIEESDHVFSNEPALEIYRMEGEKMITEYLIPIVGR